MTMANLVGEFIIAQDVTLKDVGTTKVCGVACMLVESVGQGETKKDMFSYLDMELWDTAAEYVYNTAKKGDTFIVLSCTPRQNKWEDKEGKKHSKIVFRVKSFKVIPKREKE